MNLCVLPKAPLGLLEKLLPQNLINLGLKSKKFGQSPSIGSQRWLSENSPKQKVQVGGPPLPTGWTITLKKASEVLSDQIGGISWLKYLTTGY